MRKFWLKTQNQPFIAAALSNYQRLPSRDQRALQLLLVILTIAALYMGVWAPVQHRYDEAHRELQNQQELVQWMQKNRHHVAHRQSVVSQDQATATESLQRQAAESARRHNIQLRRFEPEGGGGLRIWLENASFGSFVYWVEELQQDYSIQLSQVALDSSQPAQVNARIVLSRI
ncbi:type II secretion system protein GspM [Desulfurispira natronophila]|uniref:General secretion pathway protein M n=1 Tax=Desulfurispira natronophila TaxID=682562 RepID=A0A7W7Y6H1_9BACT|nr:type II secretion system protein M [Desulfurispira natronophila]MBB5022632.1 general secretion pathway protein M [Desulfurispira natronophila]